MAAHRIVAETEEFPYNNMRCKDHPFYTGMILFQHQPFISDDMVFFIYTFKLNMGQLQNALTQAVRVDQTDMLAMKSKQ